MNEVKMNFKTEESQYQPGDIFKTDNNEFYILADFNGEEYSAISLSSGYRWESPVKDISIAVNGLTYVGRDLSITIERDK